MKLCVSTVPGTNNDKTNAMYETINAQTKKNGETTLEWSVEKLGGGIDNYHGMLFSIRLFTNDTSFILSSTNLQLLFLFQNLSELQVNMQLTS